jgi:hypothetical protein|tara:strand:- start:435 stop:578 length:144 start_codon:yes stop_codon:yes gene_type:complete
MKKILLIILITSFSACTTIKEKTPKIGKVCPPKGERSITDIFCKEAK